MPPWSEQETSVTEYLGWAATVVFVGSYFASRAETLRRIQMVGALMWAAYGLLIGSAPVVASNLLVLSAAAWTLTRARAANTRPLLPSTVTEDCRQNA
jgi:hypothetical protein